MLVFGGGGHAKVILDCLHACGVAVAALFDDNPAVGGLLDVPAAGAYRPDAWPGQPLVIAIGHNGTRRAVAGRVRHQFGTVVHPSAEVSGWAALGEGTVVFQRAVVQAGTRIGRHVIINTAATVDHDCTLGDWVHVSPNATLCGGVAVGEGTHIGASATVIPGVAVGRWCVVGAGAVVTRPLPDYALAVGVPARIVRMLDAPAP